MGSFCSTSSADGTESATATDDMLPCVAAATKRPESTSPPTTSTTIIVMGGTHSGRPADCIAAAPAVVPSRPPRSQEDEADGAVHPNPLAARTTTTTIPGTTPRRRSHQQPLDPASFQTVRDLLVGGNPPPQGDEYPFHLPCLVATGNAGFGTGPDGHPHRGAHRSNDSIDSSTTVDTPGSDLISGGFRFGSFALELPPISVDGDGALPTEGDMDDGAGRGGHSGGGGMLAVPPNGGADHLQAASGSQLESILSSVASQQLLMPPGPPLGGGGGLRGNTIGGSSVVDLNSRRSSQLTSLGGGELTPRRASGNGSERQRRITFLAGDCDSWVMETGRTNGPPMSLHGAADEGIHIECGGLTAARTEGDVEADKGVAAVVRRPASHEARSPTTTTGDPQHVGSGSVDGLSMLGAVETS